MNARNYLYIVKYNNSISKRRADNKLATKRLLIKNDIPTSNLLHVFATRKSIKKYIWDLPQDGFVVKPARGYGGEGILVFNNWKDNVGTTVTGKEYTLRQIQSHILDIFDGIYSLQALPDKAYIEERIAPSPFFEKLAHIGLADIRIIVFNKIPVMAMLRLPTTKSHGKANLHQGALGLGIGMRTGITNNGIQKDNKVTFIPETKIKVRGIKIPDWDKILLLASSAQNASGLGFAGVDIVVDKKRGPLVLEINARPGLSIQNANMASLRTRLERVENLHVVNPERGVEIAKSVFAERFSDKVEPEEKMLSVIEPVAIYGKNGSKMYSAKIDTGAYRTSIDEAIAKELGLISFKGNFVTKSASGEQIRPAVKVSLKLGGRRISTVANVTNRSHMTFPIIIGVRDLKGFYVNPENFPLSETDLTRTDFE